MSAPDPVWHTERYSSASEGRPETRFRYRCPWCEETFTNVDGVMSHESECAGWDLSAPTEENPNE